VLDGVYRCDADGVPAYVESQAPTDDELHALLHTVITRLMKMLTRRGVLVEDMGWPRWCRGRGRDGPADQIAAARERLLMAGSRLWRAAALWQSDLFGTRAVSATTLAQE
jgi:hypothetical protein